MIIIFNKVYVLIDNEWIKMMSNGTNEFAYNDFTVRGAGSEIIINSYDTKASAVKCIADNIFFKDAKILGDAWERAYGNLAWEKMQDNKIMPWYFAAFDGDETHCFGVKTGSDTLCFWQCTNEEIILVSDFRSGSNPVSFGGVELTACEIVAKKYQSDPFDALCDFCSCMCDNPRKVNHAVFGGNDWYCNYGENSFEKILVHTKRIVECAKGCSSKPYMVIDDGWQLCHHQSHDASRYYNGGPWKYCNKNFGDMKKMADAIKSEGAIPGIWMRPLWTVEKVPDEMILKSNGFVDTLDPSHPEVLSMVADDIKTICSWGYKLIKHDFSTFDIFGKWGFQINNILSVKSIDFYDRTKTTAQIIKNFYKAIRNAAGDDVLVMGCNTISHLSAGIFDIQRTGDDTSGMEWERTKKYGVNTLAFRMAQHNSFYLTDADCVGITQSVDWKKNSQWLDVLAKSGTPLFVSIARDSYSDCVKKAVSSAFKINSECKYVSKPLDWMKKTLPCVWESQLGTDIYEW